MDVHKLHEFLEDRQALGIFVSTMTRKHKDAGDVERTFFWPIIIQRTKVFLEAYAIPSQKTHRKMGVHVLVSMVTEQIY